MIGELVAAPLLQGFRGRPAYALDAAAATVAATSRLACAAGERLVELEINPVRLVDGGARALALDFLLRLVPTTPDTPDTPAVPVTPTTEGPTR